MPAYLAGAVCRGVVRLVPDTPRVPAPDEVAWLRARVAELEDVNARLRQAALDRDELAAAQLAVRDAQVAVLAAQVEELRRRLGKDSLLTELSCLFPQFRGHVYCDRQYGHRS
jgi:hypothetical protein